MRPVREMAPGRVQRGKAAAEEASAAQRLRTELGTMADVRESKDAEEPILGVRVRAAILGWLAEIHAADDLEAVGVKPRSTALLYGPPGCGKTTLAHHLAARLGVPLVIVQADQLVEAKLGGTGRKVAALFDGLAKVGVPCVVLMDEIDAIGSERSNDDQACAREMNAALTTLLQKIEAFGGRLIAATNRHDKLDKALWRRFGLQIDVALPGDDERWAILKRYGLPFDFGDETIDGLAEITRGAAPSLLRQTMEGIKRTLVLGERLKLPVDDPAAVLRIVIEHARPHPDYEPPPLWADPSLARMFAPEAWPPTREG
ncbi:ATP-dependent zinc metalloprotease FtsH [Methylorubrum suomiense]|uniref:ATP-dependent zinc metalloprotease FtsH n=2 Tax=Methylorubrum suomiense TaxID=144191 RepID=A0ABQ4UZN5_9HYPH|nr:ATP-dependent zinc metalloprotease FtsH [Methylorubrum suomiense]